MTKTINQTIVILDPIRALTNINRTEKELLALLSQLDKKFHCVAFNEYLAKAINCGTRYIQKMLNHLEQLALITRELTNGYIRKITTIFSHLFNDKQPKISSQGDALQATNKEELETNSTPTYSKEKKVKDYLDSEISEQEQIEYQGYIEKKGDYNEVNYMNLYFHKGWMKWFKTNKVIKEKGQAIANLFRNGKNKLMSSMGTSKQYSETWTANNSLNSILNKYVR
jgi:hypothetical protein